MPGPVLDAGRVGAIALVTGKIGWEDLARHSGFTRGEVEELEDSGTVDGVVDRLPCLDARKRRLATVEKPKCISQFESDVHAGRVPIRQRLIVGADCGHVSPADDNRRFHLALAGYCIVTDDRRVTGWLRRVGPLAEILVPHKGKGQVRPVLRDHVRAGARQERRSFDDTMRRRAACRWDGEGQRELAQEVGIRLAQAERHRADDSLTKAIGRILRADLVIVDDIGLLPVSPDAAEGLYRLVDAAYERRSVAISSNLHPSGFDELMPKTLATATVNRLLHHAHLCQTTGDSVRLSQALAGKGVKPLE